MSEEQFYFIWSQVLDFLRFALNNYPICTAVIIAVIAGDLWNSIFIFVLLFFLL